MRAEVWFLLLDPHFVTKNDFGRGGIVAEPVSVADWERLVGAFRELMRQCKRDSRTPVDEQRLEALELGKANSKQKAAEGFV